MNHSLFSQSWYRVATIKPALRTNIQWSRHIYRGEFWYILKDQNSGKLHRFSQETKYIIEQMDGSSTMQEIWDSACARLDDDMPSQDSLIHLLSNLYQSNVIQTDSLPDPREFQDRRSKESRGRWIGFLKSPMSVRIPLWNPQGFLTKTEFVSGLIFNRFSASLFFVLIIAALVQLVLHWQEISQNFEDQAFSASNWLLIALIYPFVKIFHELGHGYAVRRWGGEIRELGVMLLVFIPIPYVDASDASLFRKKSQRIIVSLAGIIIELSLACLALLLWIQVEPGLFRAILFNIMIIGGVSTVLFNGNPLLKFDAYFALSDYLELPNLANRANTYLGYLVKHYFLKVSAESPANGKSEAVWFVAYSILSYLYRLTVMLTIALYVATKFYFIGSLLALWVIFQSLVLPFLTMLKRSWRDSLINAYRQRLYLLSAIIVGSIIMILGVLPVPNQTVAQGVFWAPDEAQIRAQADCFITEVYVQQNQSVSEGQELFRCDSAYLWADNKLILSQLKELQLRRRSVLTKDLVESKILAQEISRIKKDLQFSQERLGAMTVYARTKGKVRLQKSASDSIGQFVQRGDYLGFIDDNIAQIRVAVPQDDIAFVRSDTNSIKVRKASRFGRVLSAQVLRELPLGSGEIPTPSLTSLVALENWFQFDLLANEPGIVGQKVYVRFSHGRETIYQKLYRKVRRVFLSKFMV